MKRDYVGNPLQECEYSCKEDLIAKIRCTRKLHKVKKQFVPTIPRQILYHLYNEEKLFKIDIARRLNVSKDVINKHIEFYKLVASRTLNKRIMERKYLSREQRLLWRKRRKEKTCLAKYGVTDPMLDAKVQTKRANTCIERYGVAHACQSPEIMERVYNTNMQKLGCKMPRQNKTCLEKSKATCLQKYGTEYATQSTKVKEKTKQHNIDKYGYDNPSKSPEIKEKIRTKVKEATGYEYNFQRPEVIEKNHSPEMMRVKFETRKENKLPGSYSKEELLILDLLQQKYSNVKHQYYCERYPYFCDFYIPELDLFIEYQGYASHGTEPYNPNNKEHQKIVAYWKKKSEEVNYKGEKKKQYLAWIYNWTVYDVEKRNVAMKNKLNYIEFFNMNDFYTWYNQNFLIKVKEGDISNVITSRY